MNHSPPTLLILIPVYNEGSKTEQVVAGIEASLADADLDYTILVFDDGSTDWTEDIEEQLLAHKAVTVKRFAINQGKGAVLNNIFPNIKQKYTVVIDADNEYAPEDIMPVIKPLLDDDADYVMGARFGLGRERPRQYIATYLANRFFNILFNALSGQSFNDLLTGLYAFKSDLVRDICLSEQRFSYVPELAWRVHNSKKPRWKDIPIRYHFRKYAEGKKIQWWEFFTVTYAILKYRHAKGQ